MGVDEQEEVDAYSAGVEDGRLQVRVEIARRLKEFMELTDDKDGTWYSMLDRLVKVIEPDETDTE